MEEQAGSSVAGGLATGATQQVHVNNQGGNAQSAEGVTLQHIEVVNQKLDRLTYQIDTLTRKLEELAHDITQLKRGLH